MPPSETASKGAQGALFALAGLFLLSPSQSSLLAPLYPDSLSSSCGSRGHGCSARASPEARGAGSLLLLALSPTLRGLGLSAVTLLYGFWIALGLFGLATGAHVLQLRSSGMSARPVPQELLREHGREPP